MPKLNTTIILLVLPFSSQLLAQPVNVLPHNEKICMQSLKRLIVNQQIIFSDKMMDPDMRRAAERTIDITRDAFNENESYCEAQHALQSYTPDKDQGFSSRLGEVNFLGRSQP